MAYFECSAKESINVESAFIEIAKLAIKNENIRSTTEQSYQPQTLNLQSIQRAQQQQQQQSQLSGDCSQC